MEQSRKQRPRGGAVARAAKFGWKIYFPRRREDVGLWYLINAQPEEGEVEQRVVLKGVLI